MKTQCDDCLQPKESCPSCKARSQARADRQRDELRIDGFQSLEQKHNVEEMEERALYPFGRA